MTAPIHHTSRAAHSADRTAGRPGRQPGDGAGTGTGKRSVFVQVWRQLPFFVWLIALSGRVNLWYGLVFVLEFIGSLVKGSLIVAWQVLDFRRQPGTAIIAVHLRTDDDLIMTHTAVTASLIPGSLIVDADRDRRILYLHVIGVRDHDDVERQRASVLHWERRIVMAVGSRAQLALVNSPEGAA